MASEKPLKVLIVGASTSGLTLAHCLDRVNIDYEIFDGHPVAPPVGASICLLPNGVAVLDQLGLYKSLAAITRKLKNVAIYASGGRLINVGYPGCMLPRQALVQMLYDHIADKSKIHAGSGNKVRRVEHRDDCIELHTTDGAVIRGDLVVGCDGVHSTIRSEMWRIARAAQPEAFAEDASAFASEYRCLFGISGPVPGMGPGDSHLTTGKAGYLLFDGANGDVFWFLYEKMDRKYTWPDVARFTPQQGEALAAEHVHDVITGEMTFGDVWKARKTFGLLPMEEGVMKNWHWGRIAVLGDAAHKVSVNAGQGGNSAIEDAAACVNALNAAVKASPSRGLSLAEITTALGRYQDARLPRMLKIECLSRDLCRIQGAEGIKHSLFVAVSWLKSAPWMEMQEDVVRGAVTLDFLPASTRYIKAAALPTEQGGFFSLASLLVLSAGLLAGVGIGVFLNKIPIVG
ncbi:fad binding domain-containing protein [Diplodia corticola]|uniref:Fad binding domain-containing protein n=1 Tax=Diplodia corticola TaxID=236234 RepID=A0A1J9QT19_9PEZI|nr:fad binding domain-containing protein [Diplodia corticola]OJD32110.1 fad binding domain-containing protein [Diplodia corticola]